MKRIILLLQLLLLMRTVQAQNPIFKNWDYKFGGTGQEYIHSIQPTPDGGCIIGGSSSSPASGNKTQSSWGGYDYWIVKIDVFGNKHWDKDFGGTADDQLFSLQLTSDGGYILGGISSSGISGDKTQANRDSTNFSHDFWIVKIDSIGTKQWDRTYGGSENEYFSSMRQTKDGGYILGGSSVSGISGDKTESNWDASGNAYDYWIVKVDSLGNKEWDKDLGGVGDDELASVNVSMNDGGYVLAGMSFSGISGNKTSESKGGIDYWIIKVDSLGSIEWDKDFGGIGNDIPYSMENTIDDGYVIAGTSTTGINGDKTQPNWDNSNSTSDYWIVKLDAYGNIHWNRDYGGTLNEARVGNISLTHDGGYVVVGVSYSEISGNKTENNLGIEQIWVVKTDSPGTVEWDKTMFTSTEDESGYAVQAKGGCYFISNNTHSGPAGYVTQEGFGFEDFWLLEFCDSASIPNWVQPSFIAADNVTVYPNPASENLFVNYSLSSPSTVKIELYDVLGNKLREISNELDVGEHYELIDTREFPNGVYYLKILVGEEITSQKIVVMD